MPTSKPRTTAEAQQPRPKMRKVSVAIPFCASTHKLLLVTSRKHRTKWLFPKGGFEPEIGETRGLAAVREAWEEAGTPKSLVDPGDPILVLSGDELSTKRASEFAFFVIQIANESDLEPSWLEENERVREWVTPVEALSRLQAWVTHRESKDATASLDSNGDWREDQMLRGLKAFAAIYGWTGAEE